MYMNFCCDRTWQEIVQDTQMFETSGSTENEVTHRKYN